MFGAAVLVTVIVSAPRTTGLTWASGSAFGLYLLIWVVAAVAAGAVLPYLTRKR